MRPRYLAFASAPLMIAAAIARAAVTRDGVGPFEYAIAAAAVALLVLSAYRLSRRSFR